MIHRSFNSVVLVVTFASAISFRWFRSFRFGGFVPVVLGFSTCQKTDVLSTKYDGELPLHQ